MAPTNATADSKLPVYFYIQGGGFSLNSNPNINASGIIKAASHDLVVVSINYRVGPYGFLTNGDSVVANNGLRDQRKALEWVQRNIAKFGGNPDHVVIGGTSAGAASVVMHLTANNGTNMDLFHGAIASSPSFATTLTIAESQYQYNHLVTRLGCAVKDSLGCLRNKTTTEIQKLNYNIPLPGGAAPPLFQWLPVLDFDFITDYAYRSLQEGNFIKIPTIFGDDTNGGTQFAPKNLTTLAESGMFLLNQYPTLTPAQLGDVEELYPNPNKTCPKVGCYWRRTANVYQEIRYMCPALHANAIMRSFAPSYAYQYNVEDPEQMEAGLGVPHTIDLEALIGAEYTDEAPVSYQEGEINERITTVIQGYWTSFMRTLDPNKYREEGTAEWAAWGEGESGQNRMILGTGGRTEMVNIGSAFRERCEYWVQQAAGMFL